MPSSSNNPTAQPSALTQSSGQLPAQLQAFLTQLQTDYPEFTFKFGSRFLFRPPRTIYLEQPPSTPSTPPTTSASSSTPAASASSRASNSPYPPAKYALLAAHELAHALLKHKGYQTHVQRLQMESAAWKRAQTLILHYQKSFPFLTWDADFAEDQLDSYRDWLHVKSRCPVCGLTRFQTTDGRYHCPQCDII